MTNKKNVKVWCGLLALFLLTAALIPNVETAGAMALQVPPAEMNGEIAGVYAITALGSSLDPGIFSDPNVDGIVVRTTWQDTEPQPGQFEWSFIDGEIDRATTSGKKVILIVLPGAYTPAWALDGAQTAIFKSRYGHSQGEDIILPMPWDSIFYLVRWYDFVSALGERYDSNPTVVMVPAVGPTSISAEMSLPNKPVDVERWLELGYTKEKYETAWMQTIDFYIQAFPSKNITLTLYPALPIPDRAARKTVRQDLVEYGVIHYPTQFGIQSSGLTARKAKNTRLGYELVKSYSGIITTGFGLGTAASSKPRRMGGTDPYQALLDTVDLGLAAGVKYLVIYEKDILDPVTQPVIQYAHEQLTGQ